MKEAKKQGNDNQSSPIWEMSFLDRWVDRGGRWFSYLFLISGLAIVYEVIARYVFGAPTIWSHETTTLLCALCFAYGGCYCLARNSHIRIVILYDRVSPKFRRYLDLFSTFAGLIWGCMLIYAAYTLVEKSWFTPLGEFHMETSASAWDPPFPAWTKAFLMFALIVMTLQFLLRLIKTLRQK
jgi:TRAP-type C4-dicarboxylate transport system permease small subunit